jgi:hypothetical protein
MSEELKNKIRRERILEIIYNQKNKLVYNRNTFYNSAIPKFDAYYKSPTQFSLKDLTEDDIIDLKNKKLKKDCVDLLYTMSIFKIDDKLINDFKEMDIDDVLLNTYRKFLEYQIISNSKHGDDNEFNNMSLDDIEETLDKRIAKKENEHGSDDELKRIMERCKVSNDSKKSWWNIF